MRRLRVLITNITLAHRTGTEMSVRDVALALLARGHQPIVYSSDPGIVGEEIALGSVPVVSDLADVGATPDVIHGHHHPELVQAMLHFPGVPAIFFSHDAFAWHDAAPRFARVRRYVAVDEANFERIVCRHGIPPERVVVLHNAVDLDRFVARGPLPPHPRRALVFSNYAREDTHLVAVRAACARVGLPLDVVGAGVGKPVAAPETLLCRYDLVFAKARCALEAAAVGAAVVLCDFAGTGPMVTSGELARLRRLNFGHRLLTGPLDADILVREIRRYDAADAAVVSARIREEASLEPAVERLLALYEDVIAEQETDPTDLLAESRSLADYLRAWGPRFKDGPLRSEIDRLTHERDALQATRERLDAELQATRAERSALATDLERTRVAAAAAARYGEEQEAAAATARVELESARGELSYLTTTATWKFHELLVRLPLAIAFYRVLRLGITLGRRLIGAPLNIAGPDATRDSPAR